MQKVPFSTNSISREAKRESDLLITGTITDWIGRREALLPINQNYDKIRETNKPSIERWTIKRRYECWTQQFLNYSTKCTATAREKWRVLSNYKHDAYTVQLML